MGCGVPLYSLYLRGAGRSDKGECGDRGLGRAVGMMDGDPIADGNRAIDQCYSDVALEREGIGRPAHLALAPAVVGNWPIPFEPGKVAFDGESDRLSPGACLGDRLQGLAAAELALAQIDETALPGLVGSHVRVG